MLRFLTAGESHGKGLIGILEGIPKGVPVAQEDFVFLSQKRWGGYGRGGRTKIENDAVEILSGIRHGLTLGTPIGILIDNKDYPNWKNVMNSEKNSIPNENDFSVPRPGHADLAGGMKFATKDLRDILERASARETAIRVAISVPARNLLEKVGIKSLSFVSRIGEIGAEIPEKVSFETLMSVMEKADPAFLTPDPKIIPAWKALVDRCHKLGDTLGGALEIRVGGLPPGLGSHVHWDRRLDGRLAHAVMSLPGVKAVEIGDGISISRKFGSEARDEITYSRKTGFHRIANHSGGLEGGITNGEQLVVRCSMKPIPSIKMGFSIDVRTHKRAPVPVVRSDTVAVHALAVAAESVVILELAGAFLEKFGGDSLEETNRNFTAFKKVLKSY